VIADYVRAKQVIPEVLEKVVFRERKYFEVWQGSALSVLLGIGQEPSLTS
jgi:hypothetical protein